jgi:gluconate 2-dehydrogenase gamma chain
MPDHDSPGGGAARLFPRRRFLRDAALLTGGAVAAAGTPAGALAAGASHEQVAAWLNLLAPSSREAIANYTPVVLTTDEIATLKAAVGRLIPTDELGPGADDAGAHVYIDRSLKGPNAAMLPLYQAGLAALDKASGAGGFAAAGADKQDQVLTQAEAGKLAGAPAGFFALLLEHTREGMFGDPMYGGNADFAGWDLLAYPGIKFVWSAEEQAIGTIVKPEHRSVADQGGTPS